MLKEIKTSYYEPLCNFTEAEKILDLQRARRARSKSRMRSCVMWKRLCGVILIVLGCVVSVIDDTAGTAVIACIAIGMGLISNAHA